MSGLNLLSTEKNSAAFSPGYAPTDLPDLVGPSFMNVRQNYTTDAELRLIGEPLKKRNSLLQERMGKSISDLTGTAAKYTNPTAEGRAAQAKEDNDLIDNIILTGRKENSGLWDGILTTAEIREEGKRVANEAAQRYEDIALRNPSGASRIGGTLIGGIGGAFTDPVNIATLPIGAGEAKIAGTGALAVARGLTFAALKEGALQASIEAASIPQIAAWQNKVGHQYGLAEAATDVGFGFLGGAGIRLAAEGVVPAIRGTRTGVEKVSSYMMDQVATRAPGIRQTVRDGLKYMSRAAYVDESAPVPVRSHKDLREHRAAADKVVSDINTYQRPSPELPGVKKVVTPRNEIEIEVKGVVVELDDLITSNMKGFDQSLQPRDRSNRIASDVRIQEIAARLDPQQLGESRVTNTGAPIVGQDMMVESGNGRVMALKRAYEAHPESAKAYREFLEAQGHKTKGFKNPVLVSMRVSDLTPAQRKDFVVFSNEDVADRLSATERAMADARLMVIDQYKGGDPGAAINAKFIKDFVERAVSPAERNAFLTPSGDVSQEGLKRVKAAMLARAYADPALVQRLMEDADNDIKTIGRVLLDLAGDWSKLRAGVAANEIPAHLDITRDLMDAVRTIINARNDGRPISEFVNQKGLFAETDLTAPANAIIRGMYNPKLTRPLGYDQVREFLGFYVREAGKAKSGPDLLGQKPLEAIEILEQSLARIHKEATLEMKFDKDGSPEIAAIRDAGLQDEAAKVRHPKTGRTLLESLDEMAALPETIKAKGYKGKARVELRKKILNDLMQEPAEGYTPGKTIEIILGPPGAGKSSVIVKRLQKELGAIVIDSDIVKEKLPEFKDGIGANAVHEESGAIKDEWLEDSIANGWNIVHPIIGANPQKTNALVDEMLSLGYTVNVRLVHIPSTESMRRVISRFGEEGRLLPPSFVMGIGDRPLKTFDTLKQREGINAYTYFDNNVKFGQEPRIVETNDPRYVARQEPRSRELQGAGAARGVEEGGEAEGKELDRFFDDNAYRLREYRDHPPTVANDAEAGGAALEVKPTDRLEAVRAQFDEIIKENPDMMITLDDGTSLTAADYLARIQADEKVIEALTTCRLA